MNEGYALFVGVDWATEEHEVCVLGADREIRARRKVPHTGTGLGDFVDWLSKLADSGPELVCVAIEVPRGAVVETLVERGFHVYSINPKQLDRFRDRHTTAGAKDDRRDAFVLADSARTDLACFRRVRLDEPAVIQLRELSRMDDDLRQELNGHTNRLREQVHRVFPQALALCASADEPWFWALLELAPVPTAMAKVKPKQIQNLLRTNRIRRVSAEQVLATLREPPVRVAPGAAEAAATHIRMLVPRVRLAHQQRVECAERIQTLLNEMHETPAAEDERREHRDVEIILSLPGVGKRIAATMLAEASQALGERDYHALRAHSGVAPVTHQSGKRRTVAMRQGCSDRLRNAMYHWARLAALNDPAAGAQYQILRERGHSHGRALRSLADRLLRILMAMLRGGTLYDPMKCRAMREALA